MKYEYIVIGAGAAGLSFAALMEKRGHKVAILESHSLPGGCSSYFERDGFTFDAGATTLSGLKKGRPLEQLIKQLNLNLDLVSVDPGVISWIDDKKIRHFSDSKKWISELTNHFPAIDHNKLWNKLYLVDERGWKLSTTFKNIPIRSFKSLISFFSFNTFSALLSLPALISSVFSTVDKLKIKDKIYLQMLDELLFITAQNKMQDTPLLMGAMGLSYPEDTAYAMGGMKAFSNALALKCSHIFYKHQVIKITPINKSQSFEVMTSKGTFSCAKLVSTIPFWNHNELFEDEKGQNFFTKTNRPDPKNCWSAFMIYLTIPLDKIREGLYHQIHCAEIPNCFTKSFFVSLSNPNDILRSIDGRQTVTISTHTRASEWLGLENEEYKRKKENTKNFILSILKEKFQLQDSDLQNILTGSPKTFIKYTKRYNGLVGGVPHSLTRNPLSYILARSPYKNFYMLGDTQFPGQGIAAVVMGSQNLADFLSR
ncbi:MAG: NAD(P)/FAD-dependent oxidoreductase [Bacteriovorax sp.]|nr:NAD(P)/FAD-dependent oxidoreductase [Bacteriovorax sp.]